MCSSNTTIPWPIVLADQIKPSAINRDVNKGATNAAASKLEWVDDTKLEKYFERVKPFVDWSKGIYFCYVSK